MLPSTAPAAAPDEAFATTLGTVDSGGSGSSVKSSSHTEPRPPPPGGPASPTAARGRGPPPPAGPQANRIWRLRVLIVVHSRGYSKSRRTYHQTLLPVESTSLNSRWLVGMSAFMRMRNT